jgi:feruloyl esterase
MKKSAIVLLLAGFALQARGADWLDLPVVKPVTSCEQLASADLGRAAGAGVTVQSTTVQQSPKGSFCRVVGVIEPAVGFQVDLPIEHWTQRFAQSAQDTLPVARAGTNQPALDGELVVAITDKGGPGISRDTPWSYDNQEKRIDWAYRANHVTSLVAKALISAFYGQAQRYSYFIGCSMGGREALAEVQRFPDDFDGVAAGAPVVIDSLHNAFFHGWEWQANRRADGSIILAKDRLGILHDAVMQHCAAKSGVLDGVLLHPTACRFDPAWVQCSAGGDAAKCLTAEEARTAQRLYDGPTDAAGRHLDMSGFPLGSELYWQLSTAAGPADDATNAGRALVRILSPTDPKVTPATMDEAFGYNHEWFEKVLRTAPLWDVANTNLRPFQKHGGKLILWIGGSDLTVQPPTTIAYYEGVQKELGARQTDGFARFFLLPGVGHCGGGEGPSQVDVVSPLMAWTELHRSPGRLVAGKTAGRGEGGARANPYSEPAAPTLFTRPVFPYPQVARYTGSGDPKDAAHYTAVQRPAQDPRYFPAEIMQLFGPDNQKFYGVESGRLVIK